MPVVFLHPVSLLLQIGRSPKSRLSIPRKLEAIAVGGILAPDQVISLDIKLL
ncbi:hypothetical protein [Coleofasciculus sp. H7-2]|uniref:hypothetical protein n=1 Tax=Coleofasciculus sp. H7-2 TaxID=3351545 RepID=UPI00366D5A7F